MEGVIFYPLEEVLSHVGNRCRLVAERRLAARGLEVSIERRRCSNLQRTCMFGSQSNNPIMLLVLPEKRVPRTIAYTDRHTGPSSRGAQAGAAGLEEGRRTSKSVLITNTLQVRIQKQM